MGVVKLSGLRYIPPSMDETMDETGPDLATRLKGLREQAGLTRSALAKPRYTPSHVSLIESGRRRPSPEAIRFFSERLGVSPNFLATGIPDGADQQLRHLLEEARRLVVQGALDEAERVASNVAARAEEFGLAPIRIAELRASAYRWFLA